MGKLVWTVLAILVLMYGCTSAPAPKSGWAGPAGNLLAGPAQFSLNETVTTGNISFRVAGWGYADKWDRFAPPKGAKILWIHLIAQNNGGVPKPLPNTFNVEYRGINATKQDGEPETEYMERLVTYRGMAVYYDKEFYKGDGADGFLLFAVSDDLGADEATFQVTYEGKQFAMKLDTPPSFQGPDLTISDEKLVCAYVTPVGNYSHCRIMLSLTNNMPTPLMSRNESGFVDTNNLYLDIRVNDKFQGHAGTRLVSYQSGSLEGPDNIILLPDAKLDTVGTPEMFLLVWDNRTMYMYVDRSMWNDDDNHMVDTTLSRDSRKLGTPGEIITASIAITGSDGEVYAQKNGITLQIPSTP